jgi:hypothetical protein
MLPIYQLRLNILGVYGSAQGMAIAVHTPVFCGTLKMTIPQHPFRSQWQPIEVDVVGYRLIDTIETTALEAMHIFYNQHPMDVVGHPIGLFPAIDSSDPKWNFRIAHYGHMLGDSAEETLHGTIRFMNV